MALKIRALSSWAAVVCCSCVAYQNGPQSQPDFVSNPANACNPLRHCRSSP
jgi:hypothetical protein